MNTCMKTVNNLRLSGVQFSFNISIRSRNKHKVLHDSHAYRTQTRQQIHTFRRPTVYNAWNPAHTETPLLLLVIIVDPDLQKTRRRNKQLDKNQKPQAHRDPQRFQFGAVFNTNHNYIRNASICASSIRWSRSYSLLLKMGSMSARQLAGNAVSVVVNISFY